MTDQNESDNPYQAPAQSNDVSRKKADDGPQAKINPFHYLLDLSGYAYIPAIFIFGPFQTTPGRKSDIATRHDIVQTLFD